MREALNREVLGVTSRTLDHSQIATTADVYAHLTPAMLERDQVIGSEDAGRADHLN